MMKLKQIWCPVGTKFSAPTNRCEQVRTQGSEWSFPGGCSLQSEPQNYRQCGWSGSSSFCFHLLLSHQSPKFCHHLPGKFRIEDSGSISNIKIQTNSHPNSLYIFFFLQNNLQNSKPLLIRGEMFCSVWTTHSMMHLHYQNSQWRSFIIKAADNGH